MPWVLALAVSSPAPPRPPPWPSRWGRGSHQGPPASPLRVAAPAAAVADGHQQQQQHGGWGVGGESRERRKLRGEEEKNARHTSKEAPLGAWRTFTKALA